MKHLRRNIRGSMMLIIGLYIVLIGYFCYTLFMYGERWFSDPSNTRVRMDDANPRILPGKILDRRETILAETLSAKTGEEIFYFRQYHPDSHYAAHVIGSKKYAIGGEVHFIRYLLGYDNHLFERIYQKAFLPQEVGNDVILTIDMRLQKMVGDALGKSVGSVVVINPKNGEILALVSHPAFVPDQEEATLKKDSLYNKATFGRYPPGSILKIVTAAAALEHLDDIHDRTVNCTGHTVVSGVPIRCYQGEAHGVVGLKKAMQVSCNAFFADLAISVGWKELLRTSQSFGFNEEFLFTDMKVTRSAMPLSRNTSHEELAWSGVGQGKVLVTPLHMAMIAAAVANEGVIMEPRLIRGIRLRNGRIKPIGHGNRLLTPMDLNTTKTIKAMMEAVVEGGTGKGAQIPGVSVGGKTGTAELVKEEMPHAWFIGFAPTDNPTLAIAVLLEKGGSGGAQAAPLAGRILAEAIKLGY